ncbi:MAG: DUF423 domain-containing protein [Cyclobacteriaceae bacterium]|jgi:uncharacterized membrane protein YgdD (TMEM256/DUF423 family)|nr:DUF423 domain-containing protein [Cyclobacteriaceae bacterium]
MNARSILVTGALTGLTAVALGAFGAHALKARLMASGRLDTYDLAVEYQFYHALALLATGLAARIEPSKLLRAAAWCFAGGILIFSGSLYVLSVFDIPAAGAITPVGGTAFIAGWLLLALAFAKKRGPDQDLVNDNIKS